jgi:hypothetical protein
VSYAEAATFQAAAAAAAARAAAAPPSQLSVHGVQQQAAAAAPPAAGQEVHSPGVSSLSSVIEDAEARSPLGNFTPFTPALAAAAAAAAAAEERQHQDGIRLHFDDEALRHGEQQRHRW